VAASALSLLNCCLSPHADPEPVGVPAPLPKIGLVMVDRRDASLDWEGSERRFVFLVLARTRQATTAAASHNLSTTNARMECHLKNMA
jgi:hypothetical protein